MNVFPSLLALAIGGEISGLIENSGPVAKTVLVLLLLFSLASWAIIFSKWGLLRRARVQSNRFMRMFRKSERLNDVAAVVEQFRPSPLVAVFEGAYNELRKQASYPLRITALQRATQIASSEELTRLESRLPWLATTGAVTPFIGLFGTVWGIIDAFHGLGTAGSRGGGAGRGPRRARNAASSSRATGRAPIVKTSRRMPPTPVAAPWYGSIADGWLWDSILKTQASPPPMSTAPAFSPGPWSTRAPLVGSRASRGLLVL